MISFNVKDLTNANIDDILNGDDIDVDDELENLPDDINELNNPQPKKKKTKSKPKSKPKKTSNPTPPPTADTETSIEDLIKQSDDINTNGVELTEEVLKQLGPEFADLEPDKPKSEPSQKIKVEKQISDDDDAVEDDNHQELEKPKVEIKPKKHTYKKSNQTSKDVKYEDVFDYFAGNFLNFLKSVEEPEIANGYMTELEKLAPIVFAGEEKFDPKTTKIDFRSLPEKIAPCSHWMNVSSKQLSVKSQITENKNIKKILNDQLAKLQGMKTKANSNRETASVAEIDRAIKLTNQSLKSAFPKPEFLITDYMQLQHSSINTSLSDTEVKVIFKSIKNSGFKDKEKYQILIDSSIGKFTSRKLSGNNCDDINDSYNLNYEQKNLQKAVAKGGSVTIGTKSVKFPLSELISKSTAEITVNISGTIVSFDISIRTPLNGESTIYELQEFYICPTLLTEPIPYTPEEKVRKDHSPKKPPPPPSASATTFDDIPPPPKIPLFSLKKEELGLFWGSNVSSNLSKRDLINYYNKNGWEVPKEYSEQVTFFENKIKEFEEKRDEIDINDYLKDLQNAIKREEDNLPSVPEDQKNFRARLIQLLKEEADATSEALADEEEEEAK